MKAVQNTVPLKENEDDIRLYLQRVLANKRFIRNKNSSNFLALVVDAALKGEEEKQTTLALKLFGACTKQTLGNVRATAVKLRTILTEYYGGDGRDDRIIITLPKPPDSDAGERHPAGMPYTPIFLYNSRSPAVEAYVEGLHLYQATAVFFRDHEHAIRRFNQAILLDPKFAPAYAARAEADIWEPMYRQSDPPHNPIEHAERLAKQALRLQPGFWQAHMVLGAVHSCRYQWKQAQQCFDAAMQAARDKVLDHPWYPAFLLAIGRQEEALRIATARVAEKPGSVSARSILAFLKYISRDKTLGALSSEISDFQDNCVSNLAQALSSLPQQNEFTPERNAFSFDMYFGSIQLNIRSTYFDRAYPFPGLHFLGLIQGNFRMVEQRKNQMHMSEVLVYRTCGDYGLEYKQFQRTPEFAKGNKFPSDREYVFWTPFQRALVCMAKKDMQNAIGFLQRAMDEGDPLTVFLHMWPFFDPLRDEQGFHNLIKRMRLPHLMKSP